MKNKLLFIYGPLNAGGAERVLLDFLSNLDRDKYEISLCLIVNGGTLFYEIPKDIKTFALWEHYNFYYKLAYRASIWLGNDFLLKRVLNQKIENEYDVIISFLEGMPLKIHTVLKSSAKNITWVHVDLNNFRYTEDVFYKKKEKEAYDKMDRVVCVSDDTRNEFLKRFKGLKNKSLTIYNPIDFQKVQKLALLQKVEKSADFKIVLVGRLTKQKRIDRLIKVAAKFLDSIYDVKFLIVGDGELKKELQALTKDLNTESLVEFAGYQSNPYPFINNADLLISTSAYEGFGLVLCEAMALGVPVISTKTAGPMEIIGQDEYGVLCEHNEIAIYESILKIIENDELRKHYIEKGYQRVIDFSLEKSLKQFDDLIEQLN